MLCLKEKTERRFYQFFDIFEQLNGQEKITKILELSKAYENRVHFSPHESLSTGNYKYIQVIQTIGSRLFSR